MEEFGAKFDEKVLAWVKTLSEKLEAQKDTNMGEVIAVLYARHPSIISCVYNVM